MSDEEDLVIRAFEIWELQKQGFEKCRRDYPELYKTMGSDVNQRLKVLKSMKKSELLQRASELEKEVWWLNTKYQSVEVWATNKIIKELVRKRVIHRKGSDTVNQAKREFWEVWKVCYGELRDDGIKPMAARRKIGKEINLKHGKTYSLKTLKEQLKD